MSVDLAADLLTKLDPAQLMVRAGFEPDDWQQRVLRSEAKRLLLLCSRQSGKSTTTAVLALHEALYNPGSLILLLSPGLRQSGELYKKVRSTYAAVKPSVGIERESALRMELDNSSRIVSLPGQEQTVRGYSGVALLVIDEAARVADELYYAVRPMLAVSGGRLVALSTPFGRDGWFAEEWMSNRDWERIKVTAEECSRISPEFLIEERQALGEWWFEQEYQCIFKDNVDAVFSHDAIKAAFDNDLKPLFTEDEPLNNTGASGRGTALNPDVKPLLEGDDR